MRFFVDTNILAYAVNRDATEHRAAARALEAWLSATVPWCVSWHVIYEFLRMATHPRVFPHPLTAAQALTFLTPIVESPLVHVLVPTSGHWDALRATVAQFGRPAGNVFHDLHTAVLMREHGVGEIMTADTDFRKFSFVTVTDPTATP